MKFIYPAVFKKKTDGGYAAYFPDLEFCEASGETLDDAIDNANEAARTWITVELKRTSHSSSCLRSGRYSPCRR